MNFAEPLFHLRMRSGWEAADLGILIWRRKAPLLLFFTLIPAAVLTVTLAVLWTHLSLPELFNNHTLIVFAVFNIWLKPFYDRFALHVCSIVFFKKEIHCKDLMKGLCANITQGLAGDLLWRRFSPLRGVRLPLRVLERPNRAQYQTRRETLDRGGSGFGIYLTIFCMILEYTLNIGSRLFIYLIGRLTGLDQSLFIAGQTALTAETLSVLFMIINFALVETLYIAMSFAVYINSRVITEGWDLQLIFRRLARDIKSR